MKPILFFFFLVLTGQLFAQDFALKQLENSPRHQEWINVAYESRVVRCFVAYPEISEKATVVIIIHENRGLTDWVRSFADQLAERGYIAVAPDFLSGFSAERESTQSFANSDEARDAIYKLNPDQITNDLNAVQAYAKKMPAGNSKTVVLGFCWGGSQSFRYACNNTEVKAACVFYGGAPDKKEDIEKISVPVYGFYGGNDERINSGIPTTEKMMQEAGKKYDYHLYPGAGHAYMRQGDDPSGSAENKAARDESWSRLLEILKNI